jgi:hypothetical protein
MHRYIRDFWTFIMTIDGLIFEKVPQKKLLWNEVTINAYTIMSENIELFIALTPRTNIVKHFAAIIY